MVVALESVTVDSVKVRKWKLCKGRNVDANSEAFI